MTENPFNSVPALLADWSNAESVFYYIDYKLFEMTDKKAILNELKTTIKQTDLVDGAWYATLSSSRKEWWVIHVQNGKIYTVLCQGSLAFFYGETSTRPAEFVICPTVGDLITVVPIKDVFPPLPQEILDRADTRPPMDNMYPVGEYPKIDTLSSDPRLMMVGLMENLHHGLYSSYLGIPSGSLAHISPSDILPEPTLFEFHLAQPVSRSLGALPELCMSYLHPWGLGAVSYDHTVWKRKALVRRTPYRGYEKDVVGYVSREHTRCDSPKSLSASEQAKRNRKRQLAKANRKRK